VEAGEPNAVVLVPPKGELVVPPPKGLEVGVLPKAGLLAVEPNNPPPVFEPPKGDEVFPVVEEPNPPPPPPKADVPAVAVPLPKRLPPVVVVLPKAGLAAPKALVVVLPKTPVFCDISSCSRWMLRFLASRPVDNARVVYFAGHRCLTTQRFTKDMQTKAGKI
jgi:hypothetical protein